MVIPESRTSGSRLTWNSDFDPLFWQSMIASVDMQITDNKETTECLTTGCLGLF